MKKLILCLGVTLLAFLLCSCSLFSADTATEPLPTPEPSYEPTPPEASTGVTVDGKQLPMTYMADEEIYVKLSDWTELFGEVELSEDAGIFDGSDSFVPLSELIENKGYTELYDEELDHIYYTLIPDAGSVPEGIEVPILMYHAVSDDCWGIEELFVSPSEMEKQLAFLKDNGYTTISFEDLPRLNEIEKPIMLTFDDGYLDNYTELYPLLQKYGAKATIFIITDAIYSEKYLKADNIMELSDSGLVSIQSHTATHAKLGELDESQLISEMEMSRLAVARLTGKEPFVLCYPHGNNSELSREVASRYYSYGIMMNGGKYTTGSDPFSVPRTYVARYTDIDSFAASIE